MAELTVLADTPGTPGQPGTATAARPAAAPPARRRRRTSRSRWALRLVALAYVGVLVALPLGLVLWRTVDQGAAAFVDAVTGPEAIAAFRLTAIVAGSAIVINTVFGVGAALLLARYRFRGRRLLDLLIDVPISVSPIIVGLALVL
ncbi:MAG TPA: hypothetical protein VF714_03185, partial [Jatrophihabitans sp.]